jgi:hypothetical protein
MELINNIAKAHGGVSVFGFESSLSLSLSLSISQELHGQRHAFNFHANLSFLLKSFLKINQKTETWWSFYHSLINGGW